MHATPRVRAAEGSCHSAHLPWADKERTHGGTLPGRRVCPDTLSSASCLPRHRPLLTAAGPAWDTW